MSGKYQETFFEPHKLIHTHVFMHCSIIRENAFPVSSSLMLNEYVQPPCWSCGASKLKGDTNLYGTLRSGFRKLLNRSRLSRHFLDRQITEQLPVKGSKRKYLVFDCIWSLFKFQRAAGFAFLFHIRHRRHFPLRSGELKITYARNAEHDQHNNLPIIAPQSSDIALPFGHLARS